MPSFFDNLTKGLGAIGEHVAHPLKALDTLVSPLETKGRKIDDPNKLKVKRVNPLYLKALGQINPYGLISHDVQDIYRGLKEKQKNLSENQDINLYGHGLETAKDNLSWKAYNHFISKVHSPYLIKEHRDNYFKQKHRELSRLVHSNNILNGTENKNTIPMAVLKNMLSSKEINIPEIGHKEFISCLRNKQLAGKSQSLPDNTTAPGHASYEHIKKELRQKYPRMSTEETNKYLEKHFPSKNEPLPNTQESLSRFHKQKILRNLEQSYKNNPTLETTEHIEQIGRNLLKQNPNIDRSQLKNYLIRLHKYVINQGKYKPTTKKAQSTPILNKVGWKW